MDIVDVLDISKADTKKADRADTSDIGRTNLKEANGADALDTCRIDVDKADKTNVSDRGRADSKNVDRLKIVEKSRAEVEKVDWADASRANVDEVEKVDANKENCNNLVTEGNLVTHLPRVSSNLSSATSTYLPPAGIRPYTHITFVFRPHKSLSSRLLFDFTKLASTSLKHLSSSD